MKSWSATGFAASALVLTLAACSPAAPPAAVASPAAPGTCNPALVASLKGLSLEAARARLDAERVSYRVVRDGDKSFPVTMDYRPDRVGLEIEADTVVAASCG